MPFFAIVLAHSGDLLDVVVDLDGSLPPGVIAVELPAKEDDIRAWLARMRKDRGGGGGREMSLDREDAAAKGGHGGAPDEMHDAQAFFARLRQELLRAEVESKQLCVVLFEITSAELPAPRAHVTAMLNAAGHDLLATDCVSQIRDQLIGAIMADVDGEKVMVKPDRGTATVLAYPRDRVAIEQLQRRRHPLLRRTPRRYG